MQWPAHTRYTLAWVNTTTMWPQPIAPQSLETATVAGFILALAFSLILVPRVRALALRQGWVDTIDERKIHTGQMARVGGIAIWLGFMLAFWLLALAFWEYPHGNGIAGVMAGGAIMFIIGLLDDRYGMSPYIKLGGQFVAALVAFFLGVQVNTLDLPNSQLLILNGLSLPITVLWIIGISNAMNFIDGVDGLAGGVTAISALILAIVAIFTMQPVAALLAALLAGAVIGFLVFNFHPARLFMGDSGALFCGFMLATIAVTGVLKTQVVVMLLPIVALSVPILDITYSTMRRLMRGQNPFRPDADHLHHRLLRAGFSQVRTVMLFYALCIVSGVFATGYVNSLMAFIVVMLVVILLFVGLLFVFRPDATKDLLHRDHPD